MFLKQYLLHHGESDSTNPKNANRRAVVSRSAIFTSRKIMILVFLGPGPRKTRQNLGKREDVFCFGGVANELTGSEREFG